MCNVNGQFANNVQRLLHDGDPVRALMCLGGGH